MTETIIHLDGELPIQILNERGWIQGKWEDGAGHVCAHQAIRLCVPVPGDAFIIEQVAERLWGKGVSWNDSIHTTESKVREWLGGGIDVTDEELAEVFGINWRAVIDVMRKSATLTPDQVKELSAARDAAWGAAWGAARGAARDAALVCVTWDLATHDGPFTYTKRDLLIKPWESVFELPDSLTRSPSEEDHNG